MFRKASKFGSGKSLCHVCAYFTKLQLRSNDCNFQIRVALVGSLTWKTFIRFSFHHRVLKMVQQCLSDNDRIQISSEHLEINSEGSQRQDHGIMLRNL